MPVLFTGPGRHPGQVLGRSPWLQPVHLRGSESLIGSEAEVRVLAAHPNSLSGLLVAGAAGIPDDQRQEEPAPA